jgi:glycine cleavage system H protein
MSTIPDDLRYTREDEWVRLEGDEGVIGITDYAQDALSDIVYVELPDTGAGVSAGDSVGVIESVKAAADLYVPLSGEVTAVNDNVRDTPELLNSDPYGEGWLLRIRLSDPSEVDGLMDAAAYKAYCDSRA